MSKLVENKSLNIIKDKINKLRQENLEEDVNSVKNHEIALNTIKERIDKLKKAKKMAKLGKYAAVGAVVAGVGTVGAIGYKKIKKRDIKLKESIIKSKLVTEYINLIDDKDIVNETKEIFELVLFENSTIENEIDYIVKRRLKDVIDEFKEAKYHALYNKDHEELKRITAKFQKDKEEVLRLKQELFRLAKIDKTSALAKLKSRIQSLKPKTKVGLGIAGGVAAVTGAGYLIDKAHKKKEAEKPLYDLKK